jgi:hypothetical protein
MSGADVLAYAEHVGATLDADALDRVTRENEWDTVPTDGARTATLSRLLAVEPLPRGERLARAAWRNPWVDGSPPRLWMRLASRWQIPHGAHAVREHARPGHPVDAVTARPVGVPLTAENVADAEACVDVNGDTWTCHGEWWGGPRACIHATEMAARAGSIVTKWKARKP